MREASPPFLPLLPRRGRGNLRWDAPPFGEGEHLHARCSPALGEHFGEHFRDPETDRPFGPLRPSPRPSLRAARGAARRSCACRVPPTRLARPPSLRAARTARLAGLARAHPAPPTARGSRPRRSPARSPRQDDARLPAPAESPPPIGPPPRAGAGPEVRRSLAQAPPAHRRRRRSRLNPAPHRRPRREPFSCDGRPGPPAPLGLPLRAHPSSLGRRRGPWPAPLRDWPKTKGHRPRAGRRRSLGLCNGGGNQLRPSGLRPCPISGEHQRAA